MNFDEGLITPEPPKNSRIQVDSNIDSVTLSWDNPGHKSRYLIVIFLVIWLGGIVGGAFQGGFQFIGGRGNMVFVAEVALWLLPIIVAGAMLINLLRPHKPESITLERDYFKYDSGLSPSIILLKSYHSNLKKHRTTSPLGAFFVRRKVFEFHRDECPEFVLEGIGEDQRLRFDDGADRITIGDWLREPEREWLAQVLIKWRNV